MWVYCTGWGWWATEYTFTLCLVVDAMSIVTGCLEGNHTGEPAVQQRMGFYAGGHTKELSGMIFLKKNITYGTNFFCSA